MKQLPRDPLGQIAIRTLAGWANNGEVPVDAHVR